jgi:hypothetical protein
MCRVLHDHYAPARVRPAANSSRGDSLKRAQFNLPGLPARKFQATSTQAWKNESIEPVNFVCLNQLLLQAGPIFCRCEFFARLP